MTSTHALDPHTLLRHAGFVRAVARAAIRGDADVDDVVQDTWLALLQGGPRRPGPLRPWLAKVARRRAADVHRKRARVQRREEAAARPEAQGSTVDLASRAEQGRRVVEAVLSLKEPYRTALLLRYYDDLPPRQVAARMGTPVETARTRVRRGLEQLRERFDREHDGDRRAWMVALLPLEPSLASASAPSLLLGLGLGKVLLIAAVIAAGIALLLRASVDDTSLPHETIVGQTDETPTLKGRARPEGASDAAVVLPGTIRGRVVGEGVPQVCRVELRALDSERASSPIRRPTPSWLYAEVVGDGEPLARATSRDDGIFVFERVSPGTYEVRAHSVDRRVATRTVHLHGHELAAPLVLELPSGPVLLTGRAVHADGRPFRGWIRVHVDSSCTVTMGYFGVELVDGQGLVPVAEDGGFVVRGVPATSVRLAAMRPSVLRYLSKPIVLPRTAPYRFVVDEHMSAIRGRVVAHESGRPIAGARVEASARSHAGARVCAGAETDREGRFRLVLPEDELAVTVTAPGRVRARRGASVRPRIELHSYGYHVGSGGPDVRPLAHDAVDGLVIRMLKAARVTGVVRAAAGGEPVADVPVMAIAENFPSSGDAATTRTDAAGRYVLEGLPPGACAVFAAGSGWMSAGLAFVPESHAPNPFVHDLVAGEESAVDLTVVPATRASGRVIDPDGVGVSGAAVRAMPHGAFPPLVVGTPAWLGTAVSDDEGRFTFETLVPGFEYRFHAEVPGHPHARTKRITLPPAGRDDLEIRLEVPHWMTVRVEDAATGEPIPGVRLGVSMKGAVVTASWWTGADGRALVGPLPSGKPEINVRVPGYRRLAGTVASAVRDAANPSETVIRFARGGMLAGRVTVPAGVPAAGVQVRLTPPRTAPRRSVRPQRTQTDAEGRFQFLGLPQVPCAIDAKIVHDGRIYEGRIEASPGSTLVEIELAENTAGSRWPLTVLDAGGHAVHAAAVVLHVKREDGDHDRQRRDVFAGRAVLHADGDVETAWIEVHTAVDEAGVPRALGAILHHPLPVGGGPVEVHLPPALAIQGAVRDAAGRAVVGARVFAHPPGVRAYRTRPDRYAHAAARTDATGAFRLDRLGAAVYTLTFLLPSEWLPVEPLEAMAGGAVVQVEPVAAARPWVRVRDGDGSPVGGARVTAGKHDEATDTEGVARLAGLVPGRPVRLEVRGPTGRHDLAHYVDEAWVPEDLDVVLRPAGVLSGRIRDPSGAPLPYARLAWRTSKGAWRSERIQWDGTFRVEGLPLGTEVELFARTGFDGGSEPPADCIHQARAGDEHLVLTALPTAALHLQVDGDLGEASNLVAMLVAPDGHPMMTQRNADGIFVWPQVSPVHRFTLYVPVPGTGRYGLLEDVDPLAGPHVMTLVQAEDLRGRVRLPAGAEHPRVWARHAALSVSGVVAENGSFVVRGLFPGSWTIHASARVGGKTVTGTAPSAPGQTVTIDLE